MWRNHSVLITFPVEMIYLRLIVFVELYIPLLIRICKNLKSFNLNFKIKMKSVASFLNK